MLFCAELGNTFSDVIGLNRKCYPVHELKNVGYFPIYHAENSA